MNATICPEETLRQPMVPPKPQASGDRGCLVRIYPANVIGSVAYPDADQWLIGRDNGCDVVIEHPSVSRHHARITWCVGEAILEDLQSTNGVLLNDLPVARAELRGGDRVQIGTHLFKYLAADDVESHYHEIVYAALTHDALTGTHNRRSLIQILQRDYNRVVRRGGSLSLVAIDLDHFKTINDRYGHLVGDEVLRQAGDRLGRAVRPDDVLARFGGEEFLLLLTDTTVEDAASIARRCRAALADEPFDTSVGPVAVTASFGVATFNRDVHRAELAPEDLIAMADRRMYAAKQSGRNRVVDH